MRRRHFISLLAMGAASGALAGCTSFAPVYGDSAQAGFSGVRFNFAPPKNRMEQLILNRLGIAFPNPAGPNDPVLSVNASSRSTDRTKSDPFRTREPLGIEVRAQVIIRQGDAVAFNASRVTSTSYQEGGLTLTNRESAIGAEETAARSTAEALRAAILAGYRP